VSSFVVLDLIPARAALAEFHRVLQPGGTLILTVEGMGYWRRTWDTAGGYRRRLHLLRELAGDWLLRAFDWQDRPGLRRLSHHTHFTPGLIRRLVEGAGFRVETTAVLREYGGRPWILGIKATKAG
jgi:hypothetical protein